MSRTTRRTLNAALATAATLGLVGLAPVASGAPAPFQQLPATTTIEESLRVFGLTRDQRLVTFQTDSRESRVLGHVDGLGLDARIVGIDIRPASGQLYGLGDEGGVYTINKGSAEATRVSQLSVPLMGTQFDIDFNPTVDLLRIISNTGQNLRHDVKMPTAVTTVDGTLTYPATTTTPAATATGVTAAAYTNNDADADSGTTLYDIDTNLDQLVIQSPAMPDCCRPTGS